MNQRKSSRDNYIAVTWCIGMILIACAIFMIPVTLASCQEQKAARAEAEAEAAKELDRNGGVADHIELVDRSALKNREDLSLRDVTYYSYDSQGHCIAMDRYNSDGELERYEHYTYDERGNRIREQSEYSHTGWETYKETRLTYDGENRLILEQDYDGDVLDSEYYLRYTEDGTAYAVVQRYDKDGERSSYFTTVFNENEDPVAEYDYDADGQVTSCAKYRYDEEGRQVYYICYSRGDESTTPLREVVTEYGETQNVRTSYEPLGHVNSVHYVNIDENSKTELYYLAGYSGGNSGDEIYILGQEEPSQNLGLKFWEGVWQTCCGEDIISSLNCSYDRLKSFSAYWYEDGNKIRELECEETGGYYLTTMKQYVYNEDGRMAECYRYSFSGKSLEEELQDGTRICLEYSEEKSKLTKLLHTDAAGTVLREITFNADLHSSIKDWYEPLKEQLWAEELIPTENGIVPTDEVPSETGEGLNGAELSLPCRYIVEKDDSLWKIAGQVYGDHYQFVKIYRENKAVIGPDWNFIPVGMELYLPE